MYLCVFLPIVRGSLPTFRYVFFPTSFIFWFSVRLPGANPIPFNINVIYQYYPLELRPYTLFLYHIIHTICVQQCNNSFPIFS